MPLGTDSGDYAILHDAALRIKNVSGLVCEIGLREGGGTEHIMNGLEPGRTVVSIDCYGSLPYLLNEDQKVAGAYTNDMRDKAVSALFQLANDKKLNFIFFNLDDQEFFRRFSDGVPIYQSTIKTIVNSYALVHFDGPHTLKETMTETLFFEARAPKGAMFVYDDIQGFYPHLEIAKHLTSRGWKLIEEGPKKASYEKRV